MRPDDVARIYTEQRELIRSIAYSHTRNTDAAEDIVQDAAVKMLKSRTAEVRDDRAFAATVADRAAHEHIAHEAAQCRDVRRTDPLEDAPHPEAPTAEETALLQQAVREAWATAPEAVRAVALGYTVAEVACVQGRRWVARMANETTPPSQQAKRVYEQLARWRQRPP